MRCHPSASDPACGITNALYRERGPVATNAWLAEIVQKVPDLVPTTVAGTAPKVGPGRRVGCRWAARRTLVASGRRPDMKELLCTQGMPVRQAGRPWPRPGSGSAPRWGAVSELNLSHHHTTASASRGCRDAGAAPHSIAHTHTHRHAETGCLRWRGDPCSVCSAGRRRSSPG
jgi:hypothetical protein